MAGSYNKEIYLIKFQIIISHRQNIEYNETIFWEPLALYKSNLLYYKHFAIDNQDLFLKLKIIFVFV